MGGTFIWHMRVAGVINKVKNAPGVIKAAYSSTKIIKLVVGMTVVETHSSAYNILCISLI